MKSFWFKSWHCMIYFRDSDPVTFYPADMDHLECHKNWKCKIKISMNNASDDKILELRKHISKTVKQGILFCNLIVQIFFSRLYLWRESYLFSYSLFIFILRICTPYNIYVFCLNFKQKIKRKDKRINFTTILFTP